MKTQTMKVQTMKARTMMKTQTTSRRKFLRYAVTAGTALSSLSVARSAHAAGTDEIRIALIGCGGRGGGAIRDRLQVGDNAKVVAIADPFKWRTDNFAATLREDEKFKEKIDLPDERIFTGINGFQDAVKCLRPGDQVLLCSPPGFRQHHYRAAVEHGCHVFMEKPIFTDAGGYRSVMETNRKADEKKLKVCVGLQRRYEPKYYNWIEQIKDGKIGDISLSRVYWNDPAGIWCNRRDPGESEMDFQIRNWYHFLWLCGDNICEQHVHNIDIANWAHGKGDRMCHPVLANAQGGRTVKSGPEELLHTAPPFAERAAWDAWYQKHKQEFDRHGQAWDRFFVEFTYADGSKCFSQCHHIAQTWDFISEIIHGTKGTGKAGELSDFGGTSIWKNKEKAPKGAYQWEHDCHVKAIREDQPLHDGYHGAMATMAAVLGREAAFSGKELKWDDVVEKGVVRVPPQGFDSTNPQPPLLPDADGFYEKSVAVPGIYNALPS